MTHIIECPGESTKAPPSLEEINCPKCQAELEIFTDETEITCDSCGAKIDRPVNQ